MFDWWGSIVDILIYDTLGMTKDDMLTHTIHFFIYDTIKIYILLISIIFFVSFLRSYFDTQKVRIYLQGKSLFVGNVLASLFGIITPFCTCSAIPLFLGFLQARIPIGVTFSFLISAPLNNEIAIAMLFGLFGFKITAIYIGCGLLVAIMGGYLIGKIRGIDQYVLIPVTPLSAELQDTNVSISISQRLKDSKSYTIDIFNKIYLYVLLGVGVGAMIHGYVPAQFVATYASGDSWYAVPVAVLMGIPMYSNTAGVIPLIDVLIAKGMMIGTALSFMMAITALSLPEAMILKKILHIKLIAIFFGIVGFGILLVGYLFNAIM